MKSKEQITNINEDGSLREAPLLDLYEKELGIPKNSVYVTYHGVNDWGWNGRNF